MRVVSKRMLALIDQVEGVNCEEEERELLFRSVSFCCGC